MGILGRTLKYGSFKTRLFLVLTIVCCALGLGTLAACFVLPSIYLFILCAALLIAGFALGMCLFRADRRETRQHDNANNEGDVYKASADGHIERPSRMGRSKTAAEREPENNDTKEFEPVRRVAAGSRPESRFEVNYSKAYVNKLLKLYRIKKVYTPIIIDKCDSLAISRCPAYVWDKGGVMHFLLFEPESRVVTMSMQDARRVTYRKNVEETFAEGYEIMKSGIENFEEFEDVMPVYSSERVNPYKSINVKNLYVLGKDMMITPKSLRLLRKKYDFDINIFDSFNLREQYSDYFKKAYESRVMWSDNIISQKEYQDSIREILTDMTGDMDLTRFDVNDDIDRMVKYRLITKEYADFYKGRKG